MKVAQLIENAGNTSVSGVIDIISKLYNGEQQSLNTNLCHNVVATAIKNGQVSDNDYILLLGTGRFVSHSLIVDTNGQPLADSYKHKFISLSPTGVTYDVGTHDPQLHTIVQSMTVGRFKRQFGGNSANTNQ